MGAEPLFRWESYSDTLPLEPVPTTTLTADAVSLARELLGALLAQGGPGGWSIVRIVETEAYRNDDPASHSFRGTTKRTQVMFGPPGISYVYLIYGMYNCLNVVCEPAGTGAAVLIRAVEPVWGIGYLWENRYGGTASFLAGTTLAGRGTPGHTASASYTRGHTASQSYTPGAAFDPAGLSAKDRKAFYNLTSGPGKLCRAMSITKEHHNGLDLTDLGGELVLGRWRDDYAGPRGMRPKSGGVDETERLSHEWGVVTGPRIGIREGVEQPWRFGLAGNPFLSPYPF
ncbi:MAG: DNA-3-methyladenine glycosylase [Spirochaetales bacterium]